MIPINTEGMSDFVIVKKPSLTYKLDIENAVISGKTNSLDAIRQAIYKILNTERYECIIYSWNYGVELKKFIGKPTGYIYSQIKSSITEALLQDDRVKSVENFSFDRKKSAVSVNFTVITLEGNLSLETEVKI